MADLERTFQTYEGKAIRVFSAAGEIVVLAADLPTGRTPAFTNQVLSKQTAFEPYLRTCPIPGSSNLGRRHGQVLTAKGVRLLVDFLRAKQRKGNGDAKQQALQWLESTLIPWMEGLEGSIGASQARFGIAESTVGRQQGTTVGRPRIVTVGRPHGEVSVQIGRTKFQARFEDLTRDIIRVSLNGRAKTWTALEFLESLGLLQYPGQDSTSTQ
jgi:hypothetical protein